MLMLSIEAGHCQVNLDHEFKEKNSYQNWYKNLKNASEDFQSFSGHSAEQAA